MAVVSYNDNADLPDELLSLPPYWEIEEAGDGPPVTVE